MSTCQAHLELSSVVIVLAVVPQQLITERALRLPKASFVYAIEL